jgi:hypothetical protein
MKKETEHVTATKDPTYPPQDVNDIILQIVADPACKRFGCHGRGFVGIRLNKDGSKTVILCPCAHYGETDYVRAMKRIDSLELTLKATANTHNANLVHVAVALNEIYARSIAGRLAFLRRKFSRSNGKAAATAAQKGATHANQ